MKRTPKYDGAGTAAASIRNHPLFRGAFAVFLCALFALGLYFYVSEADGGLSEQAPPRSFLPAALRSLIPNLGGGGLEAFQGEGGAAGGRAADGEQCPDMLVRRGSGLVLYNSADPSVPPLTFESVAQYEEFLERQRASGKSCPVLFFQEETNAQGEDVLRMRPTLDSTLNGLPISLSAPGSYLVEKLPRPGQGAVPPIYESAQVSASGVSAFDPSSQLVGRFTLLDAAHVSEETSAHKSADPMHNNWGGVAHAQREVASGRYEGSYVTKPVYPAVF